MWYYWKQVYLFINATTHPSLHTHTYTHEQTYICELCEMTRKVIPLWVLYIINDGKKKKNKHCATSPTYMDNNLHTSKMINEGLSCLTLVEAKKNTYLRFTQSFHRSFAMCEIEKNDMCSADKPFQKEIRILYNCSIVNIFSLRCIRFLDQLKFLLQVNTPFIGKNSIELNYIILYLLRFSIL